MSSHRKAMSCFQIVMYRNVSLPFLFSVQKFPRITPDTPDVPRARFVDSPLLCGNPDLPVAVLKRGAYSLRSILRFSTLTLIFFT